MKRMHAILAGTLLVVGAVPVFAQDAVTKVSVTSSAMHGSCPGQVYIAQGVIQVNRPTTVVYYWQSAVWPNSDHGPHQAVSYSPIAHKFDSAGSFNVTSPGLVIPMQYTGGMRLFASGFVSGFESRANTCQGKVTGMGLISVYDASRCSDGLMVLNSFVDTAGGPVTVRYVPLLNGYRGNPSRSATPRPVATTSR